jgi:hypothetical protein
VTVNAGGALMMGTRAGLTRTSRATSRPAISWA